MKKLAVTNMKGGVGKSTIAVQLAHGLAKLDFKVLLIDLDGQNDSSLFLGITDDMYSSTFFELIDRRDPAKLEDCIVNAREGLDLIPNRNIDQIDAEFHREARIDLVLDEKLAGLKDMDYDYVLIDCGPQRTRINDAVLCYVDKLIVPVQVEAASVRAVGGIYEYILDLRLSPDLVGLIVPNMYDMRTKDAKENLKFLHELFEDQEDIITEPIARRVKITEAGKMGKTVFEYDEEAANQFFKVLERLVNVIV